MTEQEGMRECSTCHSLYPATEKYFEKHKQCKGGISYRCRPCTNKYKKKYREENRDLISQRWKDKYCINHKIKRQEREKSRWEGQPLRQRASQIVASIFFRAKKDNIPIDKTYITKENIEILLAENDCCPICNVEYEVRPRTLLDAHIPAVHSIDRVEPSKGYVRNNVAIICWSCNVLKKNATPKELRRLADWIDNFLKKNSD